MTARSFISAAVATLALSAGVAQAADTPTVVIVHGAFADGSDWSRVIPLLQAKGIKVTAVQNGLDSLSGDVAAAQRAITNAPGRVVLVGHSWGGTVITQAGNDPKVAALVYVAAFAPDAGQSTADQGTQYPVPEGIKHLQADAAGYLSLSADGVASYFAQDLPRSRTDVMAATQGPIQSKAFGEKVTAAAWSTRPNWYIVSSNDRMIQPDLERDYAKKLNARTTTLPSSHVPQQSHPEEVTKVIIDAVQTIAAR
ncbi:pimeloyl-ACP methyl ester carboxylesterase [Silvimonas terrae]|uniref:Pimeloyl-ACP methyl ester carboxylesterase n=1 Tax=Silvimonas terrae TaxID=300266 RepID=A0A840RI38_9NEIS|nr:alpha/beta hydrolase [Silvimonas terrae]MBB5193329.1 pimeloyl-ACP methyl ester carboxylesterase [Silvimonas terrae]